MGRGPWWYSGEIELGFSGALRDAATVVVDDPIFGRYAYGGTIAQHGGLTEVVPHDGLRERLHILTGGLHVHLLLDRDAFAAGANLLRRRTCHLRFTLENHATFAHSISLSFTGFPAGSYRLIVDGARQPAQAPVDGALTLQVPSSGEQVAVELIRAKSSRQKKSNLDRGIPMHIDSYSRPPWSPAHSAVTGVCHPTVCWLSPRL